MALLLKNPHSVKAALECRPADVLEINLPPRSGAEAWQEVNQLALALGVTVTAHRAAVRPQRRGRGNQQPKVGRESAACARVRELPGVPLGELFAPTEQGRATGRLWLGLDCIQDPRNIGAIFRTAAFFGVAGVLLTADRSAPLSATVYDTAAGGLEYVPFSVQTNLGRALEVAKEAGVWVLGASEHAEVDVADVPRDRPWLLLIGNEAHGLRRMTLERCDQLCRISPRGPVTSLNASVAAAVLVAALTAK